jgi:hypothetical protein
VGNPITAVKDSANYDFIVLQSETDVLVREGELSVELLLVRISQSTRWFQFELFVRNWHFGEVWVNHGDFAGNKEQIGIRNIECIGNV